MMMTGKLNRRNFLGAAATGAAYLALPKSGYAAGDEFQFITPFSLSLAFGSVLYAEAAGYYADEGLTFSIQSAKGAAMAAQMVIAKQMDSGRTGGTNYIVSKVNNGAPLISIATIAQLSPFYIISSKSNPVNTVADLKGRTVGMASLGGSMEGTLDLLLSGAGLATDSVEKVKVADSAASFALIEAGRAGAFIGNTSSMIKAKAASDDVHAIPMDDGMPGQVYVAHEDAIKENPEKFVKFLRATHKSALEIATASDLEPILKAIGSKHDVRGLKDMETAKQDLRANSENWVSKSEANLLRNIPEVWEKAVSLLTEAKMIDTTPDPKSLYTNALLDKALQK
ncbi:ABC transporter substrate-binding protein [uncultured Roseibium sp.]|uniref:ABC transporter substrate-binding protein n=1 Tax=uncultured Roseibium sp. TaxID=1936171 RepID=UPI0032176310